MEIKMEINDEINKILGSTVEGSQYLSFEVENEEYAISILSVKEIIGMKKITKIPNLPEYIKGVINLRGSIIHLIDVRERFGIDTIEYSKKTVIIIIETNSKTIGIIVDQVNDVLNIEDKNIQPAFELESNIENDYIKGMAKVDERLVVLLDIEKIIKDR